MKVPVDIPELQNVKWDHQDKPIPVMEYGTSNCIGIANLSPTLIQPSVDLVSSYVVKLLNYGKVKYGIESLDKINETIVLQKILNSDFTFEIGGLIKKKVGNEIKEVTITEISICAKRHKQMKHESKTEKRNQNQY